VGPGQSYRPQTACRSFLVRVWRFVTGAFYRPEDAVAVPVYQVRFLPADGTVSSCMTFTHFKVDGKGPYFLAMAHADGATLGGMIAREKLRYPIIEICWGRGEECEYWLLPPWTYRIVNDRQKSGNPWVVPKEGNDLVWVKGNIQTWYWALRQ
jgi:hypothetical protein